MKSIISFALGILFVTAMSFTTVAPPASNMAYTALKESKSFDAEFRTIISQVAQSIYSQNWNSGSQNPNSVEGRRLAFADKILKNDYKTVEKVKQYLLQTNYSYDLNDDAAFRSQIRDNTTNEFDALAQAF